MLDWNVDTSWTLFLDRDGVINQRIMGGYVTSTETFDFLPDVLQAIQGLSQKFQRLFVVTNQQGIAKNLMTERNLMEIHTYMCDRISNAGGRIDRCYFAPNLKGASEDFRKPGSAMAEQAKIDFPEIEFNKCVMVGDTDSDIRFGKNLGMKTVRVVTEEPIGIEADLNVTGLLEFLTILNHEI